MFVHITDGNKMDIPDARLQSFLELVQTEKNYVNILDIILQVSNLKCLFYLK